VAGPVDGRAGSLCPLRDSVVAVPYWNCSCFQVQHGPLPGTASRRESLIRTILPGALILCATLLAYLPALHGGFLWDDDAHVPQAGLRSLGGLGRIWFEPGATQQYYPLLYTAFWMEHRLWGDAVVGYHLTNTLLHAAAACMVVVIVRRLAVPGALLAGLVFALHPVAVESVAWISEQKNTLSAVFYLGAFLVYLGFDRDRRAAQYWLALGLFLLALLCKTVTATLPAALLVVFWWQRGRLGWRRDVLPLLPWIGLGVFAGLFTASVEQALVGAYGNAYALSFLERCLLAGRAVWFYMVKLAWPADLIFIYPRWVIDAAVWWQWLFILGALGLAGLLYRVAVSRKADPTAQRTARAPLAGYLFFVGTLFPALGFVNVYPFRYSYVADHFQYLATLGIIVPVAAGLSLILARMPMPARSCAQVFLAGLVASYAALTWSQCRMYRDAETLYRATIARNPDCWMARNNLGAILVDQPGRLNDAIAQYQESLRENPEDPEAHSNLGVALSRLPGQLGDAIAQYQEALRQEPGYAMAHNNLGSAWLQVPGRRDDAVAEFQEALRLQPNLVDAHNNLGSAWLQVPGRLDDAIAQFQEALRLDPDNAKVHNNLGNAWLQAPGRLDDAIAQYQEALRLQPSMVDAHYDLGIGWLEKPGRIKDAIAEFHEALRLDPRNAAAWHNLGASLLSLDDYPAAAAAFREELRLKPGDPGAQQALETVLQAARDR
jgi:protein O-mannosyl-transferase